MAIGPLLARKASPFTAVVCCRTWQAWQPMLSKATLPRSDDAVAAASGGYTPAGAGVGGALRRMKVAKLTMPVEKSDAVLPVGGESGSVVPKMLMSSGSGLN